MEDLTAKALYLAIDNIIKGNKDEIAKNLFAHTDDSMTTEEIVGIITLNSFTLATKLSVQVVLELLQSQGILEIDEREIARLYLKHLSFGKEESDSDSQ